MTSLQIKKLRQELGMTQKEFGDQVGVDRITVYFWETGRSQCKKTALILINLLTKHNLWVKNGRIKSSSQDL